MSDDSDDAMDAQRRARKNLSKKQSRSSGSLINKVRSWTGKCRQSSGLLVLSTGRTTADRADIEMAGAAFRELGPELRGKLDCFLRLLLDADPRVHQALRSLDDAHAVTEPPADGFFEYAQKEGHILPVQLPLLKGALTDYRRQHEKKHVRKGAMKERTHMAQVGQQVGQPSAMEGRVPTMHQVEAMQTQGGAPNMQNEEAVIPDMEDQVMQQDEAAMQNIEGGALTMQNEVATMQDMEGGAHAMQQEEATAGAPADGLLAAVDAALQIMGWDFNQTIPKRRKRLRTIVEKCPSKSLSFHMVSNVTLARSVSSSHNRPKG